MVSTNTIQAILSSEYKLNPKEDEYIIFAYGLNKDIIGENGKISNLYGCVIPLGSIQFNSKNEKETTEKVETYITNMMRITNHKHYMVAKTGTVAFLEQVPDIKIVSRFVFDKDDRIIKIENSQVQEEKRREQISNEIQQEMHDENVDGSLEKYKIDMINCLFAYTQYEDLCKKVSNMYETFNKLRDKVLENDNQNPEYRDQFLPFLKEKLEKRDEVSSYQAIENSYSRIKDKIFPVNLIDLSEYCTGDECSSISL